MAQTFIRGTQIRDLTIGVGKLDTTVIGGDGKLLASLLPTAISSFDGTASGLVATTVQGAIDEVEGRVQTAEDAIGTLASLTTTEKTSLVGAVNELASKSGGALFVSELPAGAVDGTNTGFTISQAAFAGTLQVYLNGVLQEEGDDYTVAGLVATMVAAPLAGDRIRTTYFKA